MRKMGGGGGRRSVTEQIDRRGEGQVGEHGGGIWGSINS